MRHRSSSTLVFVSGHPHDGGWISGQRNFFAVARTKGYFVSLVLSFSSGTRGWKGIEAPEDPLQLLRADRRLIR